VQQSPDVLGRQTRRARIVRGLCCDEMAASPQPRGASRVNWATWVAVAVVLHCGFGALRIPHAVFGKRWDDAAEFDREGVAAWRLRRARLEGLPAIERLLRTTADSAVVAIGGQFKGALEYVPPLLWPRLCCFRDRLPADATTYLGRPIAEYAVIGEGTTLRLEAR